ncbi:MAG: response regulator [Candidatus Poribacteria bacterium]|nr:response regulator [Candidatus Poribacteria bacterium]
MCPTYRFFERRPEKGTEARRRKAEVPSLKQHILVVDDRPLVREFVTGYLIRLGHTVETATNGLDALEKFDASGFDLVVTDRRMPEMSGDQLASAIKSVAPTCPIILLVFQHILAGGEKPANVDFIVSKPIMLTEFRKVLASLELDSRLESLSLSVGGKVSTDRRYTT